MRLRSANRPENSAHRKLPTRKKESILSKFSYYLHIDDFTPSTDVISISSIAYFLGCSKILNETKETEQQIRWC
jgi:hypothetical protein